MGPVRAYAGGQSDLGLTPLCGSSSGVPALLFIPWRVRSHFRINRKTARGGGYEFPSATPVHGWAIRTNIIIRGKNLAEPVKLRGTDGHLVGC